VSDENLTLLIINLTAVSVDSTYGGCSIVREGSYMIRVVTVVGKWLCGRGDVGGHGQEAPKVRNLNN
jgi:hypothetical protein